MRSSQAAVDLIVAEEVSSKDVYIKKYQRPEWPGLQSGITVGIGYDLGYSTKQRIAEDFAGHVPPAVIDAMQPCAGVVGASARNLLPSVRQQILVPWDAAMAVFETRDMPKWENTVLRACPNSENLPADCLGAIVSIAYNRGASFTKSGDRYSEMRNIRTHIAAGEFEKVPAEIRHMKRLWDGSMGTRTTGLVGRREREAKLFEKGLRSRPSADTDISSSNRVSSGDDRSPDPFSGADVTPPGNDGLNVQSVTAVYDLETELVQRKLIALHYHEVGEPNGLFGGKTVAGVAAFMTDRGKDPNRGKITQELKDELSKAIAEPWTRPIAPDRANATAKDIAGRVKSVDQTWYQKLWAYVLGIPSAAVAAFKYVFGDYNDPSSAIYSVKSFFSAIPPELYFLAIAGIAGLIFFFAKKSQDATVEAYRRGEIN